MREKNINAQFVKPNMQVFTLYTSMIKNLNTSGKTYLPMYCANYKDAVTFDILYIIIIEKKNDTHTQFF